MTDRDRAIDEVERRIVDIRNQTNLDYLTVGQLHLSGYLQALEDLGLLDEKEVAALQEKADRAGDERLSELAKVRPA